MQEPVFLDEMLNYINNKEIDKFEARFKELQSSYPDDSCEFIELLLIRFSFIYFIHRDMAKLKEFVEKYQSNILDSGCIKQQIKFLTNAGIVYVNSGDTSKALSNYKEAMKLAKDNHETRYLVGIYANIASIYTKRNKFHQSLKYLTLAYNIAQDNQEGANFSHLLSNLGVVYMNLQDFKNAEFFFKTAYKTYVSPSKHSLLSLYTNLALTYSNLGNFSAADKFLQKFAEESLDDKVPPTLKIANKRIKALNYYNQKQYDQAYKILSDLYRSIEDIESEDEQLKIKANYLLTVSAYGKYDIVSSLLEDIENNNNLIKHPTIYRIYLEAKIIYYEEQGDIENALKYSKELNAFLDKENYKINISSLDEITKILNDSNKSIAMTAYEEKITELNNTNNELILQKELFLNSLEDLRKEKSIRDRFISIITHDVRSPIGNILQLLEMIEDFNDINEQKEIIGEIKSSMSKTYILINDLVSWAKEIIEQQQVSLSRFNCRELIHNLEDLYSNQLKRKGITIFNQVSDKHIIRGYKESIKTCFRNILNNAIKYSYQNTSIMVSERIEEDNIVYVITNRGAGISQKNIDNLFNVSKISALGTDNETGIGIGLILVKELVRKNNGSIKCTSVVNDSTTFELSFPLVKQ